MPGSEELVGKNLEIAKRMLCDVSDFLTKYRIPYMLDYGTLLGIVRENRLLPWDTDIDLQMSENHLNVFLKHKFQLWRMGYRVRIRRFKEDVGPFKKGTIRIVKVQTRKFLFFKKNNLMDIFIKREIEGEHTYTVGQYPFYLKSVPVKYFRELSTIEFDGKKYPIPKDYNGYLTYVYGDWKTPIKEWDFKTDDNCGKEILNIKKK